MTEKRTERKLTPRSAEGRAGLRQMLDAARPGDLESLRFIPAALRAALDVIDDLVEQEDRLNDDIVRLMRERNALQLGPNAP